MKLKRTILLTLVTILSATAFNLKLTAQEAGENPIDTIARSIIKLQDDIAGMKKIKISGYIQAQFQATDSAGISSFAGGDFKANVDKRFMIRRGRVKVVYDNRLTQFVFQLDANEVEIRTKEAYVKFSEPWLEAFSVQMGIFDVPFGLEAPVSSSALESPERGRMSQLLLPGENDLGAMAVFQMPKTSKFNFLKIEAGMFNGTGGKAVDFDFQKDFIGRISIAKATKSEKVKYGLGFSYYEGGIRQANKYVYQMVDSIPGSSLPHKYGFNVDSSAWNVGRIAKRNYIGVDAQVSFDFPFGITTIKAEYIGGLQPGSSSSTKSPSAALTDATAYAHTADTYIRTFNGAYFYFIQNIFQTKHQLVFKYDWYDPNTKVSGDQIGASGSKLGIQDLKFTTIGIGYNYKWDNNIKITFYYDMVKNETSKNLASKGYWQDIRDNVFTLRFQYKF